MTKTRQNRGLFGLNANFGRLRCNTTHGSFVLIISLAVCTLLSSNKKAQGMKTVLTRVIQMVNKSAQLAENDHDLIFHVCKIRSAPKQMGVSPNFVLWRVCERTTGQYIFWRFLRAKRGAESIKGDAQLNRRETV